MVGWIFHKNFCWKCSKMKNVIISVFLCKPHIWENSASQMISENALVQSDYKILWSLEEMHGLFRFFAWRYSLKKGSIWDFNFSLGVFRLAQSRQNLPRYATMGFGLGVERLSERSIDCLGNKRFFFRSWYTKFQIIE